MAESCAVYKKLGFQVIPSYGSYEDMPESLCMAKDLSFPAESMDLKRGYQIKTYEKIETGGRDYLCYHTMEKAAGGKGVYEG